MGSSLEFKMSSFLLDNKDSIDVLEKYSGGKATNMARLGKCGVPTPPWFCVSGEAFGLFLEQFKGTDLWSLTHAKIEELFLAGTLDSSLSKEIETRLETIKISGSSFAVRSSGVGEDSVDHSFAGQFSSYLNQTNFEQILKSLRLCWASAFTERARAYRIERKISTTHFSMGVIIQRMIIADVAGVGFSRDPIHPMKRDQMIISSVFGIGEGLVSGELDADHYYVDRKTMKTEPHLVKKDHYYAKDEKGGILKKEVEASKKEISSLSDAEIKKISEAMITLEEKLNLPQDIEWVFERGEFFCVQTRPITSLPNPAFFKAGIKGGQYILWDNSNITESYNGVTSPLTFSHIARAYRQVYIQFCDVMGVPKDLIELHEPTFRNMLGLVRGRVYYNLRNWYQMIFLFPFSAKSNSFMETMMGVKQDLKPEIQALFDFTKNPPAYGGFKKIYILGLNVWRILKVDAIIKEFKADFDRVYDKAKAVDYSKLSVQELIESYHNLNQELLFKWKAPIISDTRCMVFFGVLKSLTEKWIVKDSTPSLYNDLLAGQGDLASTEPTRMLMRVAKKIHEGDKDVREWFATNNARTVLQGLRDGKSPEVFKDFNKYIDLYGFRCINELKLESTDLHEDPTMAVDAILSFIKMKNVSIDEIMAKEGLKNQAAEDIVKKNVSGIKRIIYMWILKKARLAVKDREDLRLLRTNIFGICRRIFKSLGHRYHELGLLKEPMDVFYLSVDEIIAYQEGRSFEVTFLDLAGTRRKQFDEYRKTSQPPDRFVSEGAAGLNFLYPQVLADNDLLAAEAPVSDDPNILIGTPCSPGIVEGIVRVVREAEDAEGLNGEIMVSERTDPGWVPLFSSTSGLLIERGSLLSHSAVVARELGIPTIVGVHGGLMKKLKTGMRVRMDAGKGEIRILE
jgi:phosphohistidine swiveling domain-containing protein